MSLGLTLCGALLEERALPRGRSLLLACVADLPQSIALAAGRRCHAVLLRRCYALRLRIEGRGRLSLLFVSLKGGRL